MTGDPQRPASPLGFGCAGLLRLPSGADQVALLECAHEAGVRHFDVARMYGLGKAEEVVGRFAAPRRAEVTITTKFGIQVSEAMAKASGVQAAGRWVLRQFPGLRKRVKGRLAGSTTRDFSLEGAKASVEASFRALGLETVDFMLLHEPTGVEGIDPGLVEYLEGMRNAGRIRAFGTAAEYGPLEAVAATFPGLTDVVQVPALTAAQRRGPILSQAGRVFTFGHLQADLERVTASLKGKSEAVRALDLDPADPDAAGLLILRQAVLLNPEGTTLFFTSSRPRLQKTARYVLRPKGAGEIEALASVLA